MRKPALLTPKWKITFYSLILITGALLALPNALSDDMVAKLNTYVPLKKVALGLDLRGGSHLVLEVDSKTLLKEQLENLSTDARSALREDKIVADGIKIDGRSVIVTLTDAAKREKAIEKLKSLESLGGSLTTTQKPIEVKNEIGSNDISITMTENGQAQRIDLALAQSLEIVRKRIDQIGVAEPSIQRVGSDRIMVQLPGLEDPSQLRKLLGSTAKMTFHLLSETGRAGAGVKMLPDLDGSRDYPVLSRIALSGDRLADAQPGQDPRTGKPTINFKFDGLGARQFAKITTDNVGKPFAIVLDGKVLSAPVINEPIIGGSGQISGNFSIKEVSTISALLRAGALPAPLTVIEERTVGAGLGGDAIAMGIQTGLIGFALVFFFIIFLYGKWGMIANFALFLNIILTIAALSLIGATLTLPGIAGIILGIGIAVDANILINERVREEIQKGRSGIAAMEAGFDKAFSTILDSHITGLIATIILFQFGTGPVKGFAITMAIGILISLFTAVAVVKVITMEIVHRYRIKQIKMDPIYDFFPHDTDIKFMKARFLGIAVSIFLSAASLGLFFKPGLNYGVDFVGGIQIEASIKQGDDLAKYRHALEALNLGEISLQQFGSDQNIMIRAERQPGDEKVQTAAVERIKSALIKVSPEITIQKTEVIGPKVSGELAQAGLWAVIFSGLCIVAYIWWRFEWYFAVGAIVTLVLDITKTVGFFVLTGLDFNLTAIAAILTLVGYSVNDKVVVYDRMRENMRLYKKMPLRELIDKSINQTLARCVYNSLTLIFSMLPMAIWGGMAVHNFAIPMVFGIIVATTSSIFIAAPILLFLGDWRNGKRSEEDSSSVSTTQKAA